MNETVRTRDHEDIRSWIQQRDGVPARSIRFEKRLAVQFDESKEVVEISWKEFFEILEDQKLMMLYEQENYPENNSKPAEDQYDFVKRSRQFVGPI